MIDPTLSALLAGCFALLFLSAASHKLLQPQAFAATFVAYRVLPGRLAPLSRLVPLMEGVVGVSLLSGAARPAAAAAGALLLALYAGVVALNLHRGRRDLACGCGGPNDHRPIAAWMVWRNLILALLLGLLWLPVGSRSLHAVDALTIGAGTAVASLLYMSLEGLLGRAAPRAALRGGV